MNTYVLLALLAFLTTVLVGIHVSWLWALTVLLLLAWGYVLAKLTLNPPPSSPLPQDLVPGDLDDLEKLHARALSYCNEIIAYYQRASYRTRRYYVVSQLVTIILSGLTPILVLIERSAELRQSLSPLLQGTLSWGMIVVPGIAAIFATSSSVFNFQKQWIQAKQTTEFLEAVREEFMIGASPEYRITAQERPQKNLERKRALEHFIIKVNELHLKQVNRWAALQQMDEAQTSSLQAIQKVDDSPQTLQGTRPKGLLDASSPESQPAAPIERDSTDINDILPHQDEANSSASLELEPPQPQAENDGRPKDGTETYLI